MNETAVGMGGGRQVRGGVLRRWGVLKAKGKKYYLLLHISMSQTQL